MSYCPKCSIDLDDLSYKNIKIRDQNLLSLKLLFGEMLFEKDMDIKGFCDCCGASIQR